jgi:hypothetical protein
MYYKYWFSILNSVDLLMVHDTHLVCTMYAGRQRQTEGSAIIYLLSFPSLTLRPRAHPHP